MNPALIPLNPHSDPYPETLNYNKSNKANLQRRTLFGVLI